MKHKHIPKKSEIIYFILAILIILTHFYIRYPYFNLDSDDLGRDLYAISRVAYLEFPISHFEYGRGPLAPIIYGIICIVTGGVTACKVNIIINIIISSTAFLLFLLTRKLIQPILRLFLVVIFLGTSGAFMQYASLCPYIAWPFLFTLPFIIVHALEIDTPNYRKYFFLSYLFAIVVGLVKYNQGIAIIGALFFIYSFYYLAHLINRDIKIKRFGALFLKNGLALLFSVLSVLVLNGIFYLIGMINLRIGFRQGYDLMMGIKIQHATNYPVLGFSFFSRYGLVNIHNIAILSLILVSLLNINNVKRASFFILLAFAFIPLYLYYIYTNYEFLEAGNRYFPSLVILSLILMIFFIVSKHFRKDIFSRQFIVAFSAAILAQAAANEWYLHVTINYKIFPWAEPFAIISIITFVSMAFNCLLPSLKAKPLRLKLFKFAACSLFGVFIICLMIYYKTLKGIKPQTFWDNPRIGVIVFMPEIYVRVINDTSNFIISRTNENMPLLCLYYEPLLNYLTNRRLLGYGMRFTSRPPGAVEAKCNNSLEMIKKLAPPFVASSNRFWTYRHEQKTLNDYLMSNYHLVITFGSGEHSWESNPYLYSIQVYGSNNNTMEEEKGVGLNNL